MTDSTIEKLKKNCPNKRNHTNGPSGYLAWHSWAKRMGKTHKQSKCPDCGFYLIWKKRPKRKKKVKG